MDPAAVVDWSGEPAVVFSDGTRRRVDFASYQSTPFLGKHLVIAAVQFPDEITAAVKALLESTEPPPDRASSTVAVLEIGEDDTVVAATALRLDTDALATECLGIRLTGPAPGPAGWPLLQVRYRSWHRLAGYVASVDWLATSDPTVPEIIAQIPRAYWLRTDGGVERSDHLLVKPVAPGKLTITGMSGGSIHPFQCAVPCLLDARTVLDAMQ